MDRRRAPQRSDVPAEEAHALRTFLIDRLTEDLARLWARDQRLDASGRRPGLAAQLEVLDSLLVDLEAGALPEPRELRILLFGYGHHPEYDPGWVELLNA